MTSADFTLSIDECYLELGNWGEAMALELVCSRLLVWLFPGAREGQRSPQGGHEGVPSQGDQWSNKRVSVKPADLPSASV